MGATDRYGNDRTAGELKVKTGPNAGLTRAKNEDGRWREKRDDAGKFQKYSVVRRLAVSDVRSSVSADQTACADSSAHADRSVIQSTSVK